MIGQILYLNAAMLFVIMTVTYLVAKHRGQFNVVDVAWGLGFIAVAWSTYLQHYGPRNLMIAALVSLWGLRLVLHLGRRVLYGVGDDPRYQQMKTKWKGHVWTRAYFNVFLLQGLLIWIISLPVVIAARPYYTHFAWLIYAGAAVWFVGFTIERIADAQLAQFSADRRDKDEIMDRGLWRYSRHPNYFGELTQWWGIGIIALQSTYGWIGLAGPLLLTILIIFVSGIPTIEKRKRTNPAYAAYMRRTSRLILRPPKKAHAR